MRLSPCSAARPSIDTGWRKIPDEKSAPTVIVEQLTCVTFGLDLLNSADGEIVGKFTLEPRLVDRDDARTDPKQLSR